MLNKIKNNLNLDLIKKFDKNIMEKLCFIPFNEKNEVIFVLIHDLNCKIDAAKEVKFITQKSSKFIQISLNDFHETWNFIFSENNSEIEIIDKPKVKETTIEELKINKKAVQEEL